jgi:hypothetical protein
MWLPIEEVSTGCDLLVAAASRIGVVDVTEDPGFRRLIGPADCNQDRTVTVQPWVGYIATAHGTQIAQRSLS